MAGSNEQRVPDRRLFELDAKQRTRVDDVLSSADVGLVMVHGSRVSGSPRPDSDLDLAVLAADARPLSYAAMGTLASELSALLSVEVDVSDLSTPDAVFRYEVARSGQLLFQDRPDRLADFLAKAMIDYSDIQRFLPELIAGVARRARGGARSAAAPKVARS